MTHDLSHHRKAGFTLVELLVVIGIIALLISILLPALGKAKEAANALKCSAQQRQVVTAMIMYCQDNKGLFAVPPRVEETYTTNAPITLMYYSAEGSIGGVIRYDVGTLWPYISAAVRNIRPTSAIQDGPAVLQRIMTCPSDNDQIRDVARNSNNNIVKANFSFTWNSQIRYPVSSPVAGANAAELAQAQAATVKLSQVKSSSSKILFIEEAKPNDGLSFMGPGNSDDTPAFRHSGRACYGFADGHVEKLDPKTIGYSVVTSISQISQIVDQSKDNYYFMLGLRN